MNAAEPVVGVHRAREGFDPSYFPQLFAIEDRHFWFRARNRIIATLVNQLTNGVGVYQALEVGCGTGSVLRALSEQCPRGRFFGMDLFLEGLRFAHRRTDCSLVQATIHQPPFRNAFKVVGLFDLLEHLPDDVGALRHLRALLAPGGALLLTVPAHAALWSYFDTAARHVRRYEPAELSGKLGDAGYRVEYVTHYMTLLYPLLWLTRRLRVWLARRRSATACADVLAARELRITPVVNRVFGTLLAPEVRAIARRRCLPLGSSLLAVARPHRDEPRQT